MNRSKGKGIDRRVVFRKWRIGCGIIALFPDETYTYNVGSYTHIGQHGEADYRHVMKNTIPATPEEYAGLKKELESIGYQLTVVKRR